MLLFHSLPANEKGACSFFIRFQRMKKLLCGGERGKYAAVT